MRTRHPDGDTAAGRRGRRASTVLLGAVLVTLALLTFGRFAGPLVIAVQGVTLVYGLWTIGTRSRVRVAAAIVVSGLTAVLVLADVLARGHPARLTVALTAVMGVALAVGTIVTILRRTLAHITVTLTTVNAALSVYLLIGLGYGYLYDLIGAVAGHPVLHGDTTGQPLDYLYFSFITMTTVGYGDITPAGGFARMTAATEAIGGQLYLVTIVAMVVGNLGRQRQNLAAVRRHHPGTPPDDEPTTPQDPADPAD